MRRRLLRLAALGVALPVAARVAESLAGRMEFNRGPTVTTRSLRRAAQVADQRSGRIGRLGPWSRSGRRR